jgi:hypothetical protein
MAPLKDYQVQVGKKTSVWLPELADPDEEDTPILISIFWGRCMRIVSGNYPTYTVAPRNNKTDPGTCYVVIHLKDDNPSTMFSEFAFKIVVIPLSPGVQ